MDFYSKNKKNVLVISLKTTLRARLTFVLCFAKAARGKLPNPSGEDLHTCSPQKHPQCLPDISAMPKQQELQLLLYFLNKVNNAMIKCYVYILRGSDWNESLSFL